MMHTKEFLYDPSEHEAEHASNSYLMSLLAGVAGMPLPIVNLIATIVFYFANRKGRYFVRWHCTQALLSQLTLFIMNSAAFWWSISVIFYDKEVSNLYISYLFTIIFFNLMEFIATIFTAIQTRKGKHVYWWLYGDLTDQLIKP